MRAYLFLAVAASALALIGTSVGPVTPAAAATITFTPGWHIVAGPPGTVFRGIAALDALDAAGGGYTSLPVDTATSAGAAYFAFFTDLFVVRMAPDLHSAVGVPVAPRVWTLVGNPSAYSSATVAGVDVAYVYDQQGGYLIESSIPPGGGALVYSYAGGTATVTPVPGGIDATVADMADKLIDAAITPQDVPPGFHLTRADSNGGNNNNIPVTYVQEFRPRAAPKANDPQQTVLIQVNIQQAKDADYAKLLLDGTTTQTMRDIFGQNVQRVDTPDPPSVGEQAKLFHVQVVNGNNQAGLYLLAFRRNQLFVTVLVTAQFGKEDVQLLSSLAAAQDSRINAAF